MVTVTVGSQLSELEKKFHDIPDGETFAGTVGTVTGYFLKNRMGITLISGVSESTSLLVSLSNCWDKHSGYNVANYRPVDVAITIKERLRP